MMMKHEWKRWEAWEDPEVDLETTLDDLMIDHLGNFFGSMSVQNNDENKELSECLKKSEVQAARILGISVSELNKQQERMILKSLFGDEA